jgi:guanylate kinase
MPLYLKIEYEASRPNMSDPQNVYHFERPPLLIVISGTSGAGKDSVARALMRRMEERGFATHFVITATSRPKREDEVDGVDYFFVSKSEFERMIDEDELLEHALVYGQYRGIPRQQASEAMASGKDVIMRLDIQGAATIRRIAPEALLVFVTAASEHELAQRLKQRRTESDEQLRLRLKTARQEMEHIPEFDYVIPNLDGRLDQTVEIAMAIVTAEKHRANPRRARL